MHNFISKLSIWKKTMIVTITVYYLLFVLSWCFYAFDRLQQLPIISLFMNVIAVPTTVLILMPANFIMSSIYGQQVECYWWYGCETWQGRSVPPIYDTVSTILVTLVLPLVYAALFSMLIIKFKHVKKSSTLS